MCFQTQIVSGVRQLVERQYLASASKQEKREYAGLPGIARRLIVKAFLREQTGGSNQGAKTLLGLLWAKRAATRSSEQFVGSIAPMLYFTDASVTGWVRFHHLRSDIGVTDHPGAQVLIGSASEVGLTQDGYALWSLRVHDNDIPGRSVIVDGMFITATVEPPTR
jgi:hypothetical protein